jgi:hypothetical protein
VLSGVSGEKRRRARSRKPRSPALASTAIRPMARGRRRATPDATSTCLHGTPAPSRPLSNGQSASDRRDRRPHAASAAAGKGASLRQIERTPAGPPASVRVQVGGVPAARRSERYRAATAELQPERSDVTSW